MVPDVTISLVRVGSVEVPLPRYQTPGAAGLDLAAALTSPLSIKSLERVLVPTGLRIALPPKFEGQIRPRSGLAAKRGITILNSPGTIDSDYRGEIKILLVNVSRKTVTIEPLERIAQMVIAQVAHAEMVWAAYLDETERGDGGYGSTGTRGS